MELKLVKTDDAYPSEGNPREDFGDLEALAATFALNPANPGEPLNPPVLVRDGEVYRIVDGERRWHAMGIAGTKAFHAIVCEDWDDADAALAMLATDDKKELTEVERSKGAQRCLLLGVEPEAVEKAARVKGMRRVKRAADRLGAEAECMSLDHLVAVDELAEWPESSRMRDSFSISGSSACSPPWPTPTRRRGGASTRTPRPRCSAPRPRRPCAPRPPSCAWTWRRAASSPTAWPTR